MEIVYLFIKDHVKLKSQNLNFGSEYIFNYYEESKKLDIIKNDLYINNHYKLDENVKFLNVTSIIGQNGTGKTSILNFIKNNFPEGMGLQNPTIFITKSDNKFIIYYTEDLPIENDINVPDFSIKKIKLRKEQLRGKGIRGEHLVTFGYEFRGFNQTDLIYFSNVYDMSGGSFDLQGIHDVSTNNLIWLDYDKDVKNKIITVGTNYNVLASFENNEIHRQINFIHKFYKSHMVPFELPSELFFTTKNDYFKQSDYVFRNDSSLYDYVTNMISRGSKTLLNIKGDFKKIKFRLILNIYLSFVADFFLSHQDVNKYVVLEDIFGTESDDNIETLILLASIKLIYETFQNHFNNTYEGKQFEKICEFILLIDSLSDEKESITFTAEGIMLNIKKNDFSFLDQFMQLYTGSIFIRPFLNFRWRNISSGERALLNIYSRFNSLADSDIFGKQLNKHLIILIDEGDLYLHPQWQKSFIKILLDFLPIIYKNRTIQLIFTTNSPIPASDLFNYNTIFLEKYIDSSGDVFTIVKDSLNEQKETFAANIHTLLSDSFFVENGLIGDFASLKINEIIEQLLKRKELNSDERENMRKLIHQIGEPIIKNKLMQMYNDRFNLEIHERLDKIERNLGI